jgi:hypothetical protein
MLSWVKSATHKRSGASTLKSRPTRSGASRCSFPLVVEPLRFLAWIETSPACRISRATRFSPIAMPRPSLSSLKIRGEP